MIESEKERVGLDVEEATPRRSAQMESLLLDIDSYVAMRSLDPALCDQILKGAVSLLGIIKAEAKQQAELEKALF